ncbi:HlyD family type I secretion periplasmic adaptor subunit [Sulfitobacter sp. AS59]|uniref:HlyD family type I secretion periplasmic adaptor subunit n=1 Tax=Sulfitobacter sp. AS59 TaxID=3135784 RepID=UPI0031826C36
MNSASKERWSATSPVIIGFICLLVLVGGFGTWAVTTRIAGAIVASGKIEVDRNRQIVQHETGGVVSEILVEEGDTVSAGDLLIQLDPEQLVSQLAIDEGQLFELVARRGRLEAERDTRDTIKFDPELIAAGKRRPDLQELMKGQQNLFDVRRSTVAQQIEQLGQRKSQIGSQVRGVEAQEESLSRQLGFIEEELDSQTSLRDRGLAKASAVLTLQREEARLSGQIGELAASKAEALERMTEIDLETLKLSTATREEAITQLRDLRYRELELAEKRRALMSEIGRLDIRAPVSGIIYQLQVQTPRSIVRAADPLMFLVPQDRPLVIVVRVKPTNIDEIAVGQNVELRMSALDSQTTPQLMGQVTQISADALEDKVTGQTFYRAQIMLKPGEVENLPGETILLPGMPVEAFIRTSDHSPMTYLFKPFADYFARAFRDS